MTYYKVALGVLMLASPAHAAECASIYDNAEIELIEPDDIVYADEDGKEKIRVERVDVDLEEICGSKACYDSSELYSADAIAACGDGLSQNGLGAIYLYGDEEKNEDETPEE